MESSLKTSSRSKKALNKALSKNYATKIIDLLSTQTQLCLFGSIGKSDSPTSRMRILRSLRIRTQEDQQNRVSKSFDLKIVRHTRQQQRRKSGIEPLSEKQMHLDCLYPKTQVSQQQILLNEIQKTKERKKTIFKRMSSILIKHQTTLRTIGNQNSTNNQRNSELQLFMLQESQQPIDEPVLLQSQEVKKTKLRQLVIDSELPKVVLNISRKCKKPFASIQSYVNQKTEKHQSQKDLGSSNPFLSYTSCQSLTEMNTQFHSNSPQTQRKLVSLKAACPLPEIKLISSARNYTNTNDINFLKQKCKNSIYCADSHRKRRIETKV
ncbi:unnamed protein product (macronuclear) [Paramecium tetraurelia]|uniref:Uncharacterized protein n=1 Tax=Paramecium tetraurelia TaxID=5888 RepID=A0BGX2_PARTE|nr:uncharacterized protein GSPATT00028824001 [Paramecium tetraurelia]CAK57789.1 unnamed protein product [Paramecium tetraurelia]|eukprot:XP_001425187.1 hypothetical protein (macronuclear) [Paramecium tetraurelia strain d4-2]